MVFNEFTFKFKEIAPDFVSFRDSVNNFNYFSDYVTFDNSKTQIIYNCLLMNFANSYTRAESSELFYADLITILVSNYKKYFKIFDSLSGVYADNVDITRDEDETITENNSNETTSSVLAKNADTPTVYNPETNFVDDYTNLQSKSDGESNFSETKSHGRVKNKNIVDSINNALRLPGYTLKEMAQDFSPLFIQVDNPTIEMLYFS